MSIETLQLFLSGGVIGSSLMTLFYIFRSRNNDMTLISIMKNTLNNQIDQIERIESLEQRIKHLEEKESAWVNGIATGALRVEE